MNNISVHIPTYYIRLMNGPHVPCTLLEVRIEKKKNSYFLKYLKNYTIPLLTPFVHLPTRKQSDISSFEFIDE